MQFAVCTRQRNVVDTGINLSTLHRRFLSVEIEALGQFGLEISTYKYADVVHTDVLQQDCSYDVRS